MTTSHSNGNDAIYIRQAGPDDLPLLVSLARETFIDSYEHLNDPIHFWDYVDEALTEDKFQEEMQTPGSVFYLAFYGGFPAGFCKVNLNLDNALLPQDGPHTELERIYVQRLYKGMRIGQQLLARAIQAGLDAGCCYLWLGVWQKNLQAIAWYERQGFRRVGEKTFHMGSDVQLDWVMGLEIGR
jgi:ribosomal protein S18 acetylase RimI-like enzyme